jgi:hypothetical protein
MQGLTRLGSPGALLVLFAIVVACFVLGKLRDPAAWLVIAMSGALILDVTLKRENPRCQSSTHPSSGPDVTEPVYTINYRLTVEG